MVKFQDKNPTVAATREIFGTNGLNQPIKFLGTRRE